MRRLAAVAVLACVALLIGAHWWTAYGGQTTLGYRLEHAGSAPEIAEVAGELLELGDYLADDLLRRVSNRDPRVAFQASHRAFAVLDHDTARLHGHIAGHPLAVPGAVVSPNGSLISMPTARPMHAFEFALDFDTRAAHDVRALGISHRECWIVLRGSHPAPPWTGVRITYDAAGAPVVAPPAPIDAATIGQWRTGGQWPRGWPNE